MPDSLLIELTAALSASVPPAEALQNALDLAGPHQPAGPHTLDVPTQGLATGLYTVRVLAAGMPVYRKLVIGQ